jgi:hypothetical protein
MKVQARFPPGDTEKLHESLVKVAPSQMEMERQIVTTSSDCSVVAMLDSSEVTI